MTVARARWWVLLLALAAYANSLGNGFAYDDEAIIRSNPVVTEGEWGQAVLGPYWTDVQAGAGLYRPVTVSAFAAEWKLWGAKPFGYHAVNVALHVLVSLLVLALLARFVSAWGALAGAALFAVHPVHVEAVANTVGQAELIAAAAVLGACLLHLRGDAGRARARALRLAAIAVLYLVGLGAKEIAVTLPALLLLLELARRDEGVALADRLRRGAPVVLSLLAVLAAYLLLRASVLGTVTGEVPAPQLRGITSAERLLTALTAWPQYLRLMVFPITLSVDYGPGLMEVARTVTAPVVLGAAVLVAWLAAGVALLRRRSTAGVGLAWFAVAVLPISNLLFPVGIIVAERTLYLPSVGVAFALAGAVEWFRAQSMPARTRRLALGTALAAGAVLFVRTVSRNPVWSSTYAAMEAQAREHPESALSWRVRAGGLARVGEGAQAALAYDMAAKLAPNNYALLCEVGDFHARRGEDAKAEALLRRAIAVAPTLPGAYALLSRMLIQGGRGREGFLVALEGLARSRTERELWSLVSEAYITKGDLEAAARARRVALDVDPASVHDWERLAEILDALGRPAAADEARARAAALEPHASVPPPHPGSGS